MCFLRISQQSSSCYENSQPATSDSLNLIFGCSITVWQCSIWNRESFFIWNVSAVYESSVDWSRTSLFSNFNPSVCIKSIFVFLFNLFQCSRMLHSKFDIWADSSWADCTNQCQWIYQQSADCLFTVLRVQQNQTRPVWCLNWAKDPLWEKRRHSVRLESICSVTTPTEWDIHQIRSISWADTLGSITCE